MSAQTPRNPVGWFEIYVQDMARAKAFYEAVFSASLVQLETPDPSIEMWAFPFPSADEYARIPGACGALVKIQGCSSGGSGTLVYFSCEDCANEEQRVTAHGGGVHRSKFSIGPYGFIALVTDTEGNMIGLHSQH